MSDVNLPAMLSARYCEPEWATFWEVDLLTRRADCIALNLYRSRRAIIGIEIKESRSDWLRELKDPDKMERLYRECTSVFLCVSDLEIVKDDLPNGWGLLAPRGGKLVTKVRPDRNKPANTTEFVFRLVRHCLDHRSRLVEKEASRRVDELRATLESEDLKRALKRAENAEKATASWMSTFEAERTAHRTLVEATNWLDGLPNYEQFRALRAVEVVRKNEWLFDPNSWKLKNLHQQAETMTKHVEEIAAVIESIKGLISVETKQ